MKYIKYIHALLASLTICLDSTVNKLLAKWNLLRLNTFNVVCQAH